MNWLKYYPTWILTNNMFSLPEYDFEYIYM
ncbi:MAG: hypothetical protein RLZZ161_1073 [Bacteroidota bacterium]